MAKRITRRGRGEGSISLRLDGRWQARITLGRDKQGKQIRKILYGSTRKEAADQLATLLGRVQTGEPIVSGTPTLGAWLDRWYKHHRSPWRGSTPRIYRTAIDEWIAASLRATRLEKVTPLLIQDWVDSATKAGARTYIKTALVVLKRGLAYAQRQRLITYNPAESVVVPHPVKGPIVPMSADEVRTFLEAAADHRLYALFVTTVATGLRIGEITGVKWSNLDLVAGSLAVEQQLQPVKPENSKPGEGYPLALVPLKTAAAKRTLTLPALALAALKAHRTLQREERLRAGGDWSNPLDLVFTLPDGRPLHPDVVRKVFYALLKKAGLTHHRFHNLRHTAATLLLEQGAPLVEVSKSLGHASLSVTSDVYSHWTSTMAHGVAARMDEALKAGSKA